MTDEVLARIQANAKMAKYLASVPRRITPAISAFIESLNGEEEIYLDVTPGEGSLPGRCFLNATRYVDIYGGDLQFGWLIWELPKAFLTAEFHAVVRRDGRLIDVTPQMFGERRVLFSPCNVPAPTGYTENIYRATVDHPLVAQSVECKRRIQRRFGQGRHGSAISNALDAESTRCLDRYFADLRRRADEAKKLRSAEKRRARRKDERRRRKQQRRRK